MIDNIVSTIFASFFSFFYDIKKITEVIAISLLIYVHSKIRTHLLLENFQLSFSNRGFLWRIWGGWDIDVIDRVAGF